MCIIKGSDPLMIHFSLTLLCERYLLASVNLLELELVGAVVEVLERVATSPDRPDALDVRVWVELVNRVCTLRGTSEVEVTEVAELDGVALLEEFRHTSDELERYALHDVLSPDGTMLNDVLTEAVDVVVVSLLKCAIRLLRSRLVRWVRTERY